eukprot:TRINITY_DN10753_c0_g1_i1.p1 TRINITY_DN10753_c0_g1~~TRINITY_DN10753_c0_g1_i1.p1  ORF type:complete len:369 (+),score=56.70 TRINITY_DN10753_c0_g1_i1:161-1108(+)
MASAGGYGTTAPERLLAPPKPATSAYRVQQRGGLGFHTRSLTVLVLVPWGIFVAVALSCALLRGYLQVLSTLVAAGSLTLCVFLAVVGHFYARGPFYTYLAVLGFVATCAGWFNGMAINDRYMAHYWSVGLRPTYSNVSVQSAPASVADGGLLRFSADTRVDTTLGLGVVDQETLVTYCVAPIVGNAIGGIVSFWAAGTDCCQHRGAFACGDAGLPGARSGLVRDSVNDATGTEHWLRAAKQAAAANGLHTASRPVFVEWVGDSAGSRSELLRSAAVVLLVYCSLYLTLSFLLASLLHWTSAQSALSGSPAGAYV